MPSMLLDAQQITRVYGDRTVLDAVDVRVDAGSRIGLIGPNGAGKSALLHILAGRDAPDGGIVRCFGTVGYLPQFADVTERRLTVRETILDRVGLASAGDALDRWTDALAAGGLEAVQPHGAALERWLALGGADVDARLSAAVADLGLGDEFLDRPLVTSRRTISTPTGSGDWSRCSPPARAGSCSCRMTERCWPKRSARSWSWTVTAVGGEHQKGAARRPRQRQAHA
jgi:energy-coupling factor transporter ATP-binding protein EcfA2